MAARLPISVFSSAGHDDGWFIRRAQDIWAGQWLGTYNQMTLIKGPVYSLFLVLNKITGMSVLLSQALLYLVACLVLCGTLLAKRVSPFWVWVTLIVLLFHPALFPIRVIRDDIYFSLTLLSVAGFMRLSIPATSFWKWFGLAALGSMFGLFWFTREEGVWLLPGALVLLGAGLWESWQAERSVRRWAARAAVFLCAAMLPYLVLAAINQKTYGTFEVVDFKGPAFKEVMARLNSVSTGQDIAHLPVSTASRQAVYRISPAFRELQPYFENPNNDWKKPGCSIYPQTCGDIAGGWFAWALRSGASQLGYYRSPEAASHFYNRISADIRAACAQGALVCKPSWVPFMPNITSEGWRQLPLSVLDAIKISLYLRGAPLSGGPSEGSSARLADIDSFLGHPVRTEVQKKMFWLDAEVDKDHAPDLWCRMAGGAEQSVAMQTVSRTPSGATPPSPETTTRLAFTIPSTASCQLRAQGDPNEVVAINDLLEHNQREFHLDGHRFYVAAYRLSRTTAEATVPWLRFKIQLTKAYQVLVPVLTVVGLLSLVIALAMGVRKNARMPAFVWWSAAFWLLYATRLIVLALVDITSFPGINHLYMLPAFPILSLAALLSIWALRQAMGGKVDAGEPVSRPLSAAP